jgi:DNA (cytosine-5)-methyltransferase 1
MATKDSESLNCLQPTHTGKASNPDLKPWVGWYEAIEDLIPDMPIAKLSDKQLLALSEWSLSHPLSIEGGPKLLVPTFGYYSDLPPVYSQHRLAPTVKAMMMSDGKSERKGCWRLVDSCEVREISVRGLARLQTFPDDLILPSHKGLACKMIGNAVPPVIMEAILKHCFSSSRKS